MLKNISHLIRLNRINCSAVIVAAGNSTRFGSDKITAKLAGHPILAYSLTTLQNCDYVKEIIVVTDPTKIEIVAEMCQEYNIDKASKILVGGASRLESSLAGVSEVSEDANLIAIHDGARPLVTKSIVESVIECASKNRAAIAAIPCNDTIKILEGDTIKSTPVRANTYSAQTPQVFDSALIKGALTYALKENISVTDDASAVEALGGTVFVSPGSQENLKITRPLDLKLAELILEDRKLRFSESENKTEDSK